MDIHRFTATKYDPSLKLISHICSGLLTVTVFLLHLFEKMKLTLVDYVFKCDYYLSTFLNSSISILLRDLSSHCLVPLSIIYLVIYVFKLSIVLAATVSVPSIIQTR
jgi:hypothetical protein